jgi:hypothetical protein
MGRGPAELSWPFIVLGLINWFIRTGPANAKTRPPTRWFRPPARGRPEAVLPQAAGGAVWKPSSGVLAFVRKYSRFQEISRLKELGPEPEPGGD